MKKLLLSLTLLVGFAVYAVAETVPTAKAIYCEANTTLYFTYDEETYEPGGTFDDQIITNVFDNISSTGYSCSISHSGNVIYNGDNSSVTCTVTLRWDRYGNIPTPWVDANINTSISTLNFQPNCRNWKPTNLQCYFADLTNLTTIVGGDNINTADVTNMSCLFAGCQNLTNLDFLQGWDVSNVGNMTLMFVDCQSLQNIECLLNWDTSNLTTFDDIFYNCKSLTSLNGLQNWDLSKVKYLDETFSFCSSLTNVDVLSNWNTDNIYNLYYTFAGCNSLTDIKGLKEWNVSNVKNMEGTFLATSITNVDDLSNWDVSNVEALYETFGICKLENLDGLSNWNISKVVNMAATFVSNMNLTSIEGIKNWDISNVVNLHQTFRWCTSMTNYDAISEWNISNVKSLRYMFADNSSLLNVEAFRNWDVRNVHCISGMFANCISLQSVQPLNNWTTTNLGDLEYTFDNCKSLKGRIDLSNWDLSNLCSRWSESLRYYYKDNETHTASLYHSFNLEHFINNCPEVIGVTLGKGTFGKEKITVSGYQGLFVANCPKLRYVDLSGCTDPYNNVASVSRQTARTMFYTVPRTTVIYLPSGNTQPTEGDLENVVYTDESELLQCDKYYSEDKVDIELPHRFHADLATYERQFRNTYTGVILPYPVKINDDASDEFQPFILQEEYVEQMFFKGSDNVPANTPFVFKRKGSTNMKFAMEDVWVESTYDISGETSDNIDPTFTAWKSQGFYVTHEIEPENGKFNIPTMDDYVGTENVAYDPNRVYYIASNKFYRTDPSTLYLDPHRILYFGKWEKFSGDISGARPAAFTIEELDENSPAITAIQEAELRLDESRAAAIYDASGNRLSETKRGVNILRMADGSVKKVLRK